MATPDQIQQLTDDIARFFNPEKVILFGSYAYGLPTSGSDVDLLVIMSFEGNPLEKMADILTLCIHGSMSTFSCALLT